MKKPKGSNKIILVRTWHEDSDFAPVSDSICLGRGNGIRNRNGTPAARVLPETIRGRFPTIRQVRRTTPDTAWHPAMIERKETPAEPSLHKLLAMYDKAVRILAENLVPGINTLLDGLEPPEDEATTVPPARRRPGRR